MIVVHLALCYAVEQALEMIETMPVVTADGRGKDRRQSARVAIIIECLQERFALTEDFDRRIDERRIVHRRAPTSGMVRRSRSKTTAQQATVISAREKSRPLSSITMMPSTVR